MQRRTNIQISSLISILSIITILVQFTTYYFIDAFYLIWGISCLISILCCHVLLEQTVTYEACFNYSLLTIFVSGIIVVLSYFGKNESLLPYTGTMLGIALINWLIPMLHCFLRYMLEYGTRIDDYNVFYRSSSIVFLLFYLAVLIYGSFAKDAFPWAYRAVAEHANFTPFEIIATQIENYLYGYIPLSDIFIYLLSRSITYIPYGFYISLVLRRQTRLPRIFALLSVPFTIEVLQFFIIPQRCDIDDLLYAFLGGVLGTVLFLITSIIFRAVSGRIFLGRDSDYRYSSSALRF